MNAISVKRRQNLRIVILETCRCSSKFYKIVLFGVFFVVFVFLAEIKCVSESQFAERVL